MSSNIKYRITLNEEGKYQIKKDGASKASRVFDTHKDAVKYAVTLSDNQGIEYVDETSKTNEFVSKVGSSVMGKASNPMLKKLVSFIIVLLAGAGGYFAYDNYIANPGNPLDSVEGVVYDNFQIHFMESGTEYAGDCIYIKVLDGEEQIDILIDAGPRKSSAQTIKTYVDEYVTDNKFEYVISTHADQDHIAGFVGLSDSGTRDGILYEYDIDTFIQFSYSDKTTTLYEDYLTAVDYIENKGTKVFTAAQCFNNDGGAQDVYQLAPDIEMRILYNKYYFEEAIDENDYSVVTLFSVKDQDYLFTGDLEHSGEAHFVEYYNEHPGIVGETTFYKAGHHGSKTSSTLDFLNMIKPQMSVVSCVAGNPEYTDYVDNIFPTQAYVDNISRFTDKVYIPSVFNEETNEAESLNGNIIISSDLENVGVACSNNLTKLKDTDWISHTVCVNEKGQINLADSTIERPFRKIPEDWA